MDRHFVAAIKQQGPLRGAPEPPEAQSDCNPRDPSAMSMPSSSSLEWVRTEADLFKGKSYRRETSTWFGVFLTVIGLPLGVALLLAFYIIGESSVPYTIISTATVTRDLLGGDDGKYNSLNAICRAPGGCMVFVRYTPRAHTELDSHSALLCSGITQLHFCKSTLDLINKIVRQINMLLWPPQLSKKPHRGWV